MKRDRLLQYQLARLKRILAPEVGRESWGSVSPKGRRVLDMIHNAIVRSLRRYASSL